MSTGDILDRYSWWASLNHGGLLVAPSKLAEHFPEALPPLPRALEARLRRDLVRLREGGEGVHTAFLDTVLEEVVELHAARWIKGSQVDKTWTRTSVTREALRPRRVWLGPHGAVLPVFVTGDTREDSQVRPGVGRGRRDVARVIEWLRRAGQKVALLAGGRHLRLVHAGTDHDAFCEWDTDLWFQEGAPGPQVTALRALLGRDALVPEAEGRPSRLLAAIQATRQGQAELSTALGERVRSAVETLIRESSSALEGIDAPGPGHVDRRDIYIAATRIVMRCVVILFAEARQEDLLPRNNPVYEGSYGLNGLRNQLDRLAGARAAEHLRHSHFAWPRLLSLFSLLFHGSPHEALPVTRYGGGLFTPGAAGATDPVLRALGAFEGLDNAPSDAAVHRILELLCNSPVKVRQGKASRWIEAPVDFSDLSSEYLGILYEGLLDFELRRAPADDAMVFLDLGDEPVLSIDRLDRMTNDDLAQLLVKLAKATKKSEPAEEAGEEDEKDAEGEEEEEGQAEEAVPDAVAAEVEPAEDGAHAIRKRIHLWAERAVKAAKLVKYPRNDKDPRVCEQFNQDVAARARALVRREVMPGSWFLVRWGGTRKGSGTFYTRPQLAGPTVRRALEPLTYEAVSQTTDDATGLVTVTEWAPRKPEAILALKVCDPAMGSGSFLISALRYLTGALYESLHFHGRIERRGDGVIPRLADGLPADHPWNEVLPVAPEDPDFERRLKARLKRHVVERCLYGVDLDPLAVELAKTALWIETMDPKLPFGFVDHKLKCGNSLVGCWFDRFQDYPVMAWEREGGDKGHDRFVHHFREYVGTKGKDKGKTLRSGDRWTAAIRERRDEVIRPELKRWLEERFSRQVKFEFAVEGKSAEVLHDEALAVFEKMHALGMGDAEGRERVYQGEIVGSTAIRRLREAFDTWCALWFWPGDELEKAPGPMTLLAPGEAALEVVRRVTGKERFFHWEIEFPDVFARAGSGFDAMVGNPPWEIQKPSSLEFFSNIDPIYRTYEKQYALKQQEVHFSADSSSERDWLIHVARTKEMTNWGKQSGYPFGSEDPEAPGHGRDADLKILLDRWVQQRQASGSYADRVHPFQHQGSGADLNTYKLFLELAHVCLRVGGQLGILLPAALYTDSGSRALRELLLAHSRWSHLYAFQNERFVFESIDHRFKMAIVHAAKGDQTSVLLARFRIGPGGSPEVDEVEHDLESSRDYIPLTVDSIHRFSPTTSSILEIRDGRELVLLEKLYEHGVLLGDQDPGSWQITHRQELHMSHDAEWFVAYSEAENTLAATDIDGIWERGDAAAAAPLIQGVTIDAFNYNAKGWTHGRGNRAVWSRLPTVSNPVCKPQFLIVDEGALGRTARSDKLVYRRVARSTDTRTLIAAAVPGYPVADKTPTMRSKVANATFSLMAILNSYTFDSAVRLRCGGTQIDYHVIAGIPLPRPDVIPSNLPLLSIRLGAPAPSFARVWMRNRSAFETTLGWRRLWAVTPHERLRLRSILEAVVAHLYGLDLSDFAWILRDCDHPVAQVCNKPFSRTLDPKGFWRVDKDKDPELRHPVLSLVAFHELNRVGPAAFLAQNDGEGWMLPDTLRLADYGLGHDDRARAPQPVAGRLGERFLPWQLEQGVEESWEECRRHAETIEKILRPADTERKATTLPGAEKQSASGGLDTTREARGAGQLALEFANPSRQATIGATLGAALARNGISESDFAAKAQIDSSVVAAIASCVAPFDASSREAMTAAVRKQSPALRVAKVMRAIDELIAILPGDASGGIQVLLKAARKPL